MLPHRAAFRADAVRRISVVAAEMLAGGSAHGAGAISPLVLCLQAADGTFAVAEGVLAFGAAAGTAGFAVFGDIMGGAAPGKREQMAEFITAVGANAAGFSLYPLVAHRVSALRALAFANRDRDTGMVTFVHAALTRAGYRVIVMLFGFSAVLADAVGNGRFTVLPIMCLDPSAGRALAVVSVDHKGGVGAPCLTPGADAVGVVSRGHLVVVDDLTAFLALTFFIHLAVGAFSTASLACSMIPFMGRESLAPTTIAMLIINIFTIRMRTFHTAIANRVTIRIMKNMSRFHSANRTLVIFRIKNNAIVSFSLTYMPACITAFLANRIHKIMFIIFTFLRSPVLF